VTIDPPPDADVECLVAAYGGLKMALLHGGTTVFILDVASRTWKKGPHIPSATFVTSEACAVSGDQFIVWGRRDTYGLDVVAETLVYNMEAETWTSSYNAPTTASQTPLQEDPVETDRGRQNSRGTYPNDSFSRDTKIIIIVVIVAVFLLVTIVVVTYLCLRCTKELDTYDGRIWSKDSTSDSLDVKINLDTPGTVLSKDTPGTVLSKDTPGTVLSKDTPGTVLSKELRNPVDTSPDSTRVSRGPFTTQRSHESIQSTRLHQEFVEARLPPESPHAIVQDATTTRSVQEGGFGTWPSTQHPHTVTEGDITVTTTYKYHDQHRKRHR
jgi:hypothetical protein